MFSGPRTLGSTCHSRTSPSLAWFSHFTAWEYAKTKLHSLKEVQHQKNFHSLSLLLPRIYIANFQWKLKCPFVITWPPGTKFERSPQVGTTPGGPRAVVPSDSWGGEVGTRWRWTLRPRGSWMLIPLGCSPGLRKKIQRNPGWHVSSPDGREIGQTAKRFQNQHMRSTCCQQIRGMLACAAEEKCVHPVGKGKTRRRTAAERRWGAPCQLPNASSGKNGCFQTTARDWGEPGGRGADSQATGISSVGLMACQPHSIRLCPQPLGLPFRTSSGGVLSPRYFWPGPSLRRAASLPSSPNSHSTHLCGHLLPGAHLSAHRPYIGGISHITNPALSREKLENISRPLCLELYTLLRI